MCISNKQLSEMRLVWKNNEVFVYSSTHFDQTILQDGIELDQLRVLWNGNFLLKVFKFLEGFSDEGPRYCRPLFSARFQASPKFGLRPSSKFITFMSNASDL